MVGDENQSIYRFRNADLEVFRGERRRADESPDRDVLPLRGNFRSLPAVLAGVNEIGRRCSTASPSSPPAASTSGPGSVELLLTLDEGRGKEAAGGARRRSTWSRRPAARPPRVVAEARCLAAAPAPARRRRRGERGDIVVLLRAFTHVDAYEEALRRAGLRPFVVGGRGYWTQQQVEDLIRLLGVVSNPLDDECLFGALACSGERGQPRRALAAAPRRQRAEPPAASMAADRVALRRRRARARRPPGRVARRDRRRRHRAAQALLRDPRRPARRGAAAVARGADRADDDRVRLRPRPDRASGGAGRMANVRKLMRLAREYEADEGRDLAGFLALAADQHPPRRARGDGAGAGRGPRRGQGDDRARGQGPASSRRRGPRPRPQAERGPPARRPRARLAGGRQGRAGSGCGSRSRRRAPSASGSWST